MKAFINKSSCMFCGICGGISQDVFFIDYDGTMWALDDELQGELLEEAKYAQDVCPTRSITVEG